MKKNPVQRGMHSLFSAVLLAMIMASASFAADASPEKNYQHKKGRFSLRFPADWAEKPDADGAALTVSSADGAASVRIRTETVRGKATACEILVQQGETGQGARTNAIPEDKRRPPTEQLAAAGVTDGCIGAYREVNGDSDVLVGVAVYVRGRNAWILVQTLNTRARSVHGEAISNVARSFLATK